MAFGRLNAARTPADAAMERRRKPRDRVYLTGKIVYGPGYTADCVIRNLTDAGAEVVLPRNQASPGDFYLVVVRDGKAFEARTRWTRYPRAGLVFDWGHDLKGAPPEPLQPLRAIWAELAPRPHTLPGPEMVG